MIVQEVARKYASALFLSAKDRSLVDAAYEQMHSLQALIKKDDSILDFLSSPEVGEEEKLQLIRRVFEGRLDKLFIEFLVVLVEKRRAKYLPDVLEEFNRLVQAEKGINLVTAITAVPMSPDEEQRLIDRLAAKLNGKIELEKKVDPKIVGGMIVLTHEKVIDGSIRYGMELLEDQLRKVRVY